MKASAYGTRVDGGSVPANSRDTAFANIGCTNVAGLDRVNFVADQTIPGLGKAEGVRSRVWTQKVGTRVSSFARQSIAKVAIGSPSLGLDLIGLSVTSEAFNNHGRFGTKFDAQIAKIVGHTAGQPDRELAIPAPGRTLTIPGLAEISLGKTIRKVTSSTARISANVLDVTVIPFDTRTRVAQANTSIGGGIQQGIFNGFGAGVEARGLRDNTKVGRNPLTLLPCRGTFGKKVSKDLAAVSLGQAGSLTGVASAARATNTARVAKASTAGAVAGVKLFGDRVQITGVVGQANVKRDRGVLTRNSDGSKVLEIVIDGRRRTIPGIGKLEIPGLLRLEDDIRTRTKFGLKVIGLRITILDGSGAVIDLGIAQAGIRPGVRAGS